jgi:hypothetical protein
MSRMLIDLTGMTFGFLNVTTKAPRQGSHVMWHVRCRCGVEKTVRGEWLRFGRSKSCGCARNTFKKTKLEKRFGLVNQRFGRLWVLWRAKEGDGYSRSMMWECKCDCGKIVNVAGTSLRKGRTRSCGCLLVDTWMPAGQAVRNVTLSRYKRGAQKRELEWALTDCQFDELIKQDCHYCASAPAQKSKVKGCRGDLIYNGIDRVRNEQGYVTGNVVPCCFVCNSMKRTMSLERFIAHLRKVVDHWDNQTTQR